LHNKKFQLPPENITKKIKEHMQQDTTIPAAIISPQQTEPLVAPIIPENVPMAASKTSFILFSLPI
jgi:hypothetical protein